MERLENILRNNRMSSRPEYYSGRGATLSDLDGEILEGIYQSILLTYGKKAGKNFIKMVKGIKVMSATCFIQELYKLYYNKWNYKVSKNESGVAVGKKDGEFDLVSGFMGIGESMFSHNDDTGRIKNRFLYKHGVEPDKIITSDGFLIEYYF